MPELVPATLTPEELAEFNALEQQSAAPKPINPVKDLSAQELVDLSVKDPDNFDLVGEFRNQKDLWGDQAIVQKVADAHNLIKQRGFKFSDLPGPKKIVHAATDIVKGFGKQLWNYAQAGGAAVTGAIMGGEVEKEMLTDAQRRVAENIAGTESSLFGLSEMAKRGAEKIARVPLAFGPAGGAALAAAGGTTKSPIEFSPEEKVKDLFDAVGVAETSQDILKGHGGFMTPVGGEVVKELEQAGKPIRETETSQLAAGDPFAWYLFGKALHPVEVAGKEAAAIAGAGLKKTGAALKAAGRGVEVVPKVTDIALPVVGGITGGAKFGPAGVLGGVAAGERAAAGVEKVAEATAAGAKAAGTEAQRIGEKLITNEPIKSAYRQIVKDVIEATPAAAAGVGKGALLDIGLAATTAETPQETGAVGLGVALGALGGAARMGKHVISGQIIAPRAFDATAPSDSSGSFPVLDAMHQNAFNAATPGVKLRLNAMRNFLKGAMPDADIFLASDSAAIENALIKSGVSPEQAKQLSEPLGFFTADLPGPGGKPRRVIIARDVDAAPHESFHAVQDVIGEAGNREIDTLVRQEYGKQWDYEGQRYAQRLGVDLNSNTWEEGILDKSGWGLDAAKEKVLQSAETPEIAAQHMRDLVEDAIARNPEATEQQIWRDVLTPEEAKAVADRYIARELAAENFDAVFKHTGPTLDNKSLPGKLARLLAGMMRAFGTEPLAGRRTQIGEIEPRFRVAEAVRGKAKELPLEAPEGAEPPPVTPAPTTPPPSPFKPTILPKEETADTKEAAKLDDWVAKNPITVPDRARAAQTISDALSNRQSVQVIYYGAKGEPGGSIEAERPERRAEIEAQRDADNADRPLVRKTFTPERVEITGKGPQVIGWSPDNFFANANRFAEWVEATGSHAAVPYEISGGKFTDAGWKALQADLSTFMQNQRAGATGAGEPLVVPKEVLSRGFKQPAAEGAPALIEQSRADIINYLFGTQIPEGTGRVAPLHLAGQEISAATKPGRVEIPVTPRGEYTEAQLQKAGIPGPRGVREVNPFRQSVEELSREAGIPAPELIEVSQRLNLSRIADATVAPEVAPVRANTLTLAAGFQPKEWRVTGTRQGVKKEEIFKAETEAEARTKAANAGLRPTKAVPVEGYGVTGAFQPERVRERERREQELPSVEELGALANRVEELGRSKPSETGFPGKTFAEYETAAMEAFNQSDLALADEFLTLAKKASDLELAYGKKGAPTTADALHEQLEMQHQTQQRRVEQLQNYVEKNRHKFKNVDLAQQVWEAGGKLKEVPSIMSMKGLDEKSNVEFVDRNLATPNTEFEPGSEPALTFYYANRSHGSVPAMMRLAAKISDSGNPYGLINVLAKEIAKIYTGGTANDPGVFKDKLHRTIRDIEEAKNYLRIKRGYFGKRAPFSQLRKPGLQYVSDLTGGKEPEKPLPFEGGAQFQPERGMTDLSREPDAVKGAAIRLPSGKIYAAAGSGSMTHGGALYNAKRAGEDVISQREQIQEGFVTNAGEFLSRKEAFKRAKEFDQITGMEATLPRPGELESVTLEMSKSPPSVRMETQFQPERADEIERMTPEEFTAWAGKIPGGFTKYAYEIGKETAETEGAEGVAKLQDAYRRLQDEAAKLLSSDVQTAMTTSFKAQLFREAWEAATGLGSGGERLREIKSQAQPGAKPLREPPRDLTDEEISRIPGSAVHRPETSYPKAAAGKDNPWIRSSEDPANNANPDNAERTLMIQFDTNIQSLGGKIARDNATEYYDKLYSGVRQGYARLDDFWEIPQWMGFAAHIFPNADAYVVRDMNQAKQFLKEAKYGRVLFSAMDVNKEAIKELAKDYPGTFDVGGYTEKGTFDDTPNVRWHDTMQSVATEAGVPYRDGVDYRHFVGSASLPRLTLSSGCKYKCAFCTIEKVVKNAPDDLVQQQTDAIADLGTELVYINDKTFGQASNYQMLSDLNTRMKERNPNFKGFVVQTTASQMVKIPSDWLAKSGIKYVELGIESYNDPILRSIHKPANERLITEATQKLREHGITLIPNVLIGLPGETPETYNRTMKFLKDNADIISHANVYNLAVYKDTEMAKKITTASPGDYDENVQEKTFYTDPEVHKVFAGDLFRFGHEVLGKTPEGLKTQAQPKEAPIENIRDAEELWPGGYEALKSQAQPKKQHEENFRAAPEEKVDTARLEKEKGLSFSRPSAEMKQIYEQFPPNARPDLKDPRNDIKYRGQDEINGAAWLFPDGSQLDVEKAMYHDDMATEMTDLTHFEGSPSEAFQQKTGAMRVTVSDSLRHISDYGSGSLSLSFTKKPTSAQLKILKNSLDATIEPMMSYRSETGTDFMFDSVYADLQAADGTVLAGRKFDLPSQRGQFFRFLNNPFSEEFTKVFVDRPGFEQSVDIKGQAQPEPAPEVPVEERREAFRPRVLPARREIPEPEQAPGSLPRVLPSQAQPEKKEDDFQMPARSSGGFKKAWILPDGTPAQLGGQWHHDWLASNPEIAAKFGVENVPAFEGTDTPGVREEALKKGFARINYGVNNGALTVEARAADWPKQKDAVREFVRANAGDIDNIRISLTDPTGTKAIRTESAKLFEFDDAEKLKHIPLMEDEPTPRRELAPRSQRELEIERYNREQANLKSQAQPVPPVQRFSDPEFEAELKKLRSGTSQGQTFTPEGKVWTPEDSKVDVVSLASVNVAPKDLTRDAVQKALGPFADLLDEKNVVAGVFVFSKGGKPTASIDINAVVPKKYRDNTLDFAKANDQVAIWDMEKMDEVKSGGKGETKLKTVDEILDALDPLTRGEKVDVDEILNQNRLKEGDVRPEELSLPGLGGKKALSNAELGNMTKAEIAEHFPEAIIPRRRSEKLSSEITNSPLYKKALAEGGSEADAVEAFAQRLIDFAREREDDPSFKAGSKWYSDFVPRLKKEFGADAPLMAELLAATSPQTNVTTNFGYALDALEGIKSGRFKKIIPKFNQGLEMIANDNWQRWLAKEIKAGKVPDAPAIPTPATFLAHWINTHDLKPRQSNGKLYGQHSIPVLQVFARRWMDLNAGPKTRNFVANLLGTGHEATIDLWADRTMRRVGYSGFQDRWRILAKNQAGVSDADFAFSQKAFRRAAEQMGMQPDALQGALWFSEKQLWSEEGWSTLDLGDFRREIEKVPHLRRGIEQRLIRSKAESKAKSEKQETLFDAGSIEPRKKYER